MAVVIFCHTYGDVNATPITKNVSTIFCTSCACEYLALATQKHLQILLIQHPEDIVSNTHWKKAVFIYLRSNRRIRNVIIIPF